MVYKNIIESENTDIYYEKWSSYREELTALISDGIISIYAREKLKKLNKRHLADINIEEISNGKDGKKTLAIWGAGGCNDIDIGQMAEYFNIVLIDDCMDKLDRAKEKYHLDNNCICANFHFWDINEDEYLMFDALLKDGVRISQVCEYLDEIVNNMYKPTYSDANKFDYSIVVGLASQLCSRLVAILYSHNVSSNNTYSEQDIRMLYNKINDINQIAVDKMFKVIYHLTKCGIVAGYEIEDFVDDGHGIEKLKELTGQRFEEHNDALILASFLDPNKLWLEDISISGSKELENNIKEYVLEKQLDLVKSDVVVWPFSDEKEYIVMLRILEKIYMEGVN